MDASTQKIMHEGCLQSLQYCMRSDPRQPVRSKTNIQRMNCMDTFLACVDNVKKIRDAYDLSLKKASQ